MLAPTTLSADENYTTKLAHHSLYEKFQSESSLVSLYESRLLGDVNKDANFGILKEFDCSNGIADMLLFKLRKDWRVFMPISDISPNWIYALRKLPYRKIFTSEEFASTALVSQKRAISALNDYSRLGFCVRKSSNVWIKKRQPRQIVTKIVAIEAKLRNWKRALWQAYRYLEYSDQSWVLLDAYSIKPALANLLEFQRLNVGLASLSSTNEIRFYFSPVRRSPKSDHRRWQANAEIAKRISYDFK